MRRVIAAAATVIALGGHAAAQEWPTRPITLIVPFAAGGGIDVSARIQAQRMGELLGQSIVIENVGAAAGMAGGARVAKAAPDGYTLLIGNTGTHAFNQSLYKKPLYNAATEFEPVGLVSESPRILVARKDLPADNLPQFIAYLKANEKTAQFGSAGVGSGTHLPCVLLNLAIGVNPTHVPYRGEGPVTHDLFGVKRSFSSATIKIPHGCLRLPVRGRLGAKPCAARRAARLGRSGEPASHWTTMTAPLYRKPAKSWCIG